MTFTIVPMQATDLDAVLAIQKQAYGTDHLLEERSFFLNRLALSSDTCWVARTNDSLLGYLISYPWDGSGLPKLNQALATLPKNLNTWFLHDCAVANAARGQGVAKAMIKTGLEYSRHTGFAQNALVALAEAKIYWPKFGFKEMAISAPWKEQLQDYGDGASYMLAKNAHTPANNAIGPRPDPPSASGRCASVSGSARSNRPGGT